jgi:hypothetical protein
MEQRVREKLSVMGRAWCRATHKRTLWPIHGEYKCSTCFRRYRVLWETEEVHPEPKQLKHARHKVSHNAAQAPAANEFVVPDLSCVAWESTLRVGLAMMEIEMKEG